MQKKKQQQKEKKKKRIMTTFQQVAKLAFSEILHSQTK